MSIKIALAGNPNCGKTTLFNDLTGSNQYVGNWPGVTVEKKEGRLKGQKDVVIQDLPGIYSLSPYTLEEVVARGYLVNEKPDAILNIIDGTNIERNLYLTTQLIELGIPVVMAVNMIDLVRKNGDKIDLKKLSAELGCQAVEISALKGEGSMKAAEMAVAAAKSGKAGELPHVFTGSVEHAIAHIEESIQGKVDDRFLRWYAVKLFERDDKVQQELKLDKALVDHIDLHIADCEKEMDDDAESIITNQRYAYINTVVGKAVKKKARVEHLTISDKIDRIVTNRVLALPIFCLLYTSAQHPVVQCAPLGAVGAFRVLCLVFLAGSRTFPLRRQPSRNSSPRLLPRRKSRRVSRLTMRATPTPATCSMIRQPTSSSSQSRRRAATPSSLSSTTMRRSTKMRNSIRRTFSTWSMRAICLRCWMMTLRLR